MTLRSWTFVAVSLVGFVISAASVAIKFGSPARASGDAAVVNPDDLTPDEVMAAFRSRPEPAGWVFGRLFGAPQPGMIGPIQPGFSGSSHAPGAQVGH